MFAVYAVGVRIEDFYFVGFVMFFPFFVWVVVAVFNFVVFLGVWGLCSPFFLIFPSGGFGLFFVLFLGCFVRCCFGCWVFHYDVVVII